jgi:hypothetical protein
MAAVCLPLLFAPRCKATPGIAIALSPIAGSTDDKQGMAENTWAESKNRFARIRPPGGHGCQVGLDKGDRSWQGKTIRIPVLMACPQGLPSWDLVACNDEIPESFPHLRPNNVHLGRISWNEK